MNVFPVGYKKIETDLFLMMIYIFRKNLDTIMDIKQSMIDNITNAAVNVIQPNKNICIRCNVTVDDDGQLYELANMFPRNITFCKACIDDCHDKDNKYDQDFMDLKASIQQKLTDLIVDATKKAVTTMIVKKMKMKTSESANTNANTTTTTPNANAPTKPKSSKKAGNTRLQTLKEQYEKSKEAFVNGSDNVIYKLMENIAKKKYYKDEECAAFQEEFYQDFMQNGINWNNSMYNITLQEKLVKMRAKNT